MLTCNYRFISRTNHDAPDLDAIALSLGRCWRWVRQTPQPYNVLAHSLLVAQLAMEGTGTSLARATDSAPGDADETMLLLRCLLHDAPECIRGDIPTPWKTDEDRRIESAIAVRIEKHLGTRGVFAPDPRVRGADHLAVRAECTLLWDRSRVTPHPELPDPLPRTEEWQWALTAAERWIAEAGCLGMWITPKGSWVRWWVDAVTTAIHRVST